MAAPMPLPQTFTGRQITLHPLDVDRDVAELHAISHDGETAKELWRFLPGGPFSDAAEQAAFLRDWQSRPDVIAFTVREASSRQAVGSISLMNVRPEHGVAELGNIWYAPGAQKTGANTEACFLLLRHCFEDLGYRRMEWKCDSLNEPSRRAALRLGFSFEGIFRQHMMVKGMNRDTAWFAMLDHEWPRLGAAILLWQQGEPRVSLTELTRPVYE